MNVKLEMDSLQAKDPDGLMKKRLVVGQLQAGDVCRKHRSRSPSTSGSLESASSLDLMIGQGCGNSSKKPGSDNNGVGPSKKSPVAKGASSSRKTSIRPTDVEDVNKEITREMRK